MNRYKLAKYLYILPKVCCFFSGKDSDYKKHIINPIKKEKAYPNRLPLQTYRVTYLHTVNIVAAMSSPKLNTFFIKFFISIIHIQVYKKRDRKRKSIPPRTSFSFNYLRHTTAEKVSVAECVVDTCHLYPELIVSDPFEREGCLLS